MTEHLLRVKTDKVFKRKQVRFDGEDLLKRWRAESPDAIEKDLYDVFRSLGTLSGKVLSGYGLPVAWPGCQRAALKKYPDSLDMPPDLYYSLQIAFRLEQVIESILNNDFYPIIALAFELGKLVAIFQAERNIEKRDARRTAGGTESRKAKTRELDSRLKQIIENRYGSRGQLTQPQKNWSVEELKRQYPEYASYRDNQQFRKSLGRIIKNR